MELDFESDSGQTPISEEEKEGLRISTITTHHELNEFEQQNIEKAVRWTISQKFKMDQILTEDFVKLVHKKMYSDVWTWAGEFRKTNKNIGVDRYQVAIELRKLLDDCKYWITNSTYPPDEIAVRFKHRIVQIHCFSNGNGRHSRLMGDIIIEHIFGNAVFSWGANTDLAKAGDTRATYLVAVKAADHGDINLLLEFARS